MNGDTSEFDSWIRKIGQIGEIHWEGTDSERILALQSAKSALWQKTTKPEDGPTIIQNKASHWSTGSSLLLRSDLARSLERHLAAWHLVCWRCAHWSASGRMWQLNDTVKVWKNSEKSGIRQLCFIHFIQFHQGFPRDSMSIRASWCILEDPFQVPATRACFQDLREFKLTNQEKASSPSKTSQKQTKTRQDDLRI